MTVIRRLADRSFLPLMLLAALALRLFFHTGPIFSDDAFYNYLAYTLWQGDFAADYLGYSTCLLRVNTLAVSAVAYAFCGANEFATMIFPMLFSLANVALAYFTAKLWSGTESVARLSAALMACLPTDIIFATINFTDSPSALFINLGIYFSYHAHLRQSLRDSLLGSTCFFLSIQFKVNAFYLGIALALLAVYVAWRTQKVPVYLLLPLVFIGLNFLAEGLAYLVLRDDFFYHFNLLELNNRFARNFFLVRGESVPADFTHAMLQRAFILNPKFVFLRRFHLFLPLLALLQCFVLLKHKRNLLLVFWFVALSVIYMGFTSSFTRYQPLNLWFSWYIFPLFLPAVLLSAMFLAQRAAPWRYALFCLYLAGSVIMCRTYEINLGKPDIDALRALLLQHPEKTVFTDHHTQIGIDLIDSYRAPLRTRRILGEDFDWKAVRKNDWVVAHYYHLREQRLLDFRYPDFGVLHTPAFQVVLQRKDFTVYERVE